MAFQNARRIATEYVQGRLPSEGLRKFLKAGSERGPGTFTATQTGAKALAQSRYRMELEEAIKKAKALKKQQRQERYMGTIT